MIGYTGNICNDDLIKQENIDFNNKLYTFGINS